MRSENQYSSESPIVDPTRQVTEDADRRAFRVADPAATTEALRRDAYDGPSTTAAGATPELQARQARETMLAAYKTEEKDGFAFSVPQYREAIKQADLINQDTVRRELAAIKSQPPETSTTFRPGQPTTPGETRIAVPRQTSTVREDQLKLAEMVPVSTRVNFALA